MIYQMMFAVITPALITGAFAERVKFGPFLVFIVLWATSIYDPLAHWVWGKGGWMGTNAGWGRWILPAVLLSTSAPALLSVSRCVNVRSARGLREEAMPPHNLPFSIIGAACSGSGGSASMPVAPSRPMVSRHPRSLRLMLRPLQRLLRGCDGLDSARETDGLGAASGAVAGLVAITPGSGFVAPISAIFIGIGGGVLCSIACSLKPKFGYDDALDVVGVHGVGGTWGAMATGLFASKAVNAAGNNGLFFGNPGSSGPKLSR